MHKKLKLLLVNINLFTFYYYNHFIIYLLLGCFLLKGK